MYKRQDDVRVEIETNGSVDIAEFKALGGNVSYTLDYKCPSSGMENDMCLENYNYIDTVSYTHLDVYKRQLMKLLKDAAKVFSPAGYDIEIVEKHHNQKVDAPSGKALALADSINEACNEQYELSLIHI